MLRTPGFSLVVVLTLALGIGANTAIFSVINGLLFHPAGISHPERLVAIRVKYDKLNLKSIVISAPDFVDVRDSRQVFSTAALMSRGDFNYTAGDLPERLQGARVSWAWFDVFEVRPLIGRTFRPEEDQPNANQVAVLAYSTWQRLFGGDPGILDRTIQLSRQSYRVVGVMGPDFVWPSEAQLWVPIGLPHRVSATIRCYKYPSPASTLWSGPGAIRQTWQTRSWSRCDRSIRLNPFITSKRWRRGWQTLSVPSGSRLLCSDSSLSWPC